ncbi:unnamed protein product [Anisakis simplex]|uniref:NACHT domain-containing protein n=1 Tax=Anisakis simplex TaxID=6269 RepID=A0A0M3IY76_ANISI|nr:unnamed protein product [Anisakis simplex]
MNQRKVSIVNYKRNFTRTVKVQSIKRSSYNNIANNRKELSKKVQIKVPPQLDEQTEKDSTEKVDPKVLTAFERVFKGHFVDIPAPLSKLVRVFTSSTFTDTTVERNALMESVYPELKEFCRETHGLDFQVVDMRWGVRDEATDDHMTTKLCMTEIANCQRLSVGPNFVVFLCQKYGYRPLPSEILCTELNMLKCLLREEHEDTSLLDTWYIQDANAVPPLCILQPISSIIVNFNNKRIPKLQKQAASMWWDTEARMQKSLRKAAKMCYDRGQLSHEQMHNYFMSVTEREVIHGILKGRNPNEHCLCYVRHINNIAISQAKTASKFVDIINDEICSEAQHLLSNLRDERVPSRLDVANIRRTTIEWCDNGGVDNVFHAEYIKAFCKDFYDSITKMVNKAVKKHEKYRERLFSEVLQHISNALAVSAMFFGRDNELRVAENYVRSTYLKGENGCGKTSTLAKIAREIRHWYSDEVEPVIVLRFLGTSPDSSSITPLLTSVCDQHSIVFHIACNFDEELRGTSPTELSKLFMHFKKMTTLANAQRPLVIIFDSLDLLSNLDGAHELLWFPPTLPPHVKFFVSITPGASRIGTVIKRFVESDEQYILVPSLGMSLALEVVAEWLKSAGRTLTDRQWKLVTEALAECTLPLFVKLIHITVARWKSYSRPHETLLFHSLQEGIHALLDRTEGQHGSLLVSHALSYITAARSGLSDSEVEDLISLDDQVLDDIYQYHLPPIRRIPPLLWSRIRADLPGYLSERAADGVIVLNWYHEQFRTAATERYFGDVHHLKRTHSALADYFLGIWGGVAKPFQYTEMQKQRFGIVDNEGLADRKVPKQPNIFHSKGGKQIRYNMRRLNELPYHLLKARRLNELLSLCLFNYEFLYAKVSSFPLQAVIGDFESAIVAIDDVDTKRQLSLVADAFRLSASILSRHPCMLAFELLGRLLPLAADNTSLSSLLVKCDIQGPQTSCFLPAHHAFHSPGGPLKYSLEEHQFAVFGMELTSDQKMLVTISNIFIIWDITTGDIARVVNPNIEGIFFGLALTKDDRYAAAYSNNNQVILLSLITGEFIDIAHQSLSRQMEIDNIYFTSSNHLLIWTKSKYYLYDFQGKLIAEGEEKSAEKVNYHIRFVTWSGARDDWSLVLSGKQEDYTAPDGYYTLQQFTFCASLAFEDDSFMSGYLCIECDTNSSKIAILALDTIAIQVVLGDKIADCIDERANAIFIWKRPDAQPKCWLVAVFVEGFLLFETKLARKLVNLRLPTGVRNIPIRPMHTTTAITLASEDRIFVAGVRKYLYLWDMKTEQLLRSVDAHFGRTLNLCALTINGQNVLLSSSLDHSIKMWNMENIFEKSFSVSMMDQPIEAIHIARNAPSMAVVQTRKNLGLWNVRSHKYIATLVANEHGAVVTHCMISADAQQIVCVESEALFVWDLRTQSVVQRMKAAHVQQILYLNRERMIGSVDSVLLSYHLIANIQLSKTLLFRDRTQPLLFGYITRM